MYLNDFSVRVPEGDETPGGYVELPHNTNYTLSLRNNRSVRCDARVDIDGKHVGTWRIEAHSNILLERPAHDTGKFTFYKLGTSEARSIGLNGTDPNLGLVKITFMPAKKPRPMPVYRSAVLPQATFTGGIPGASSGRIEELTCSVSAKGLTSHSAGGTGLSGESRQRFYTVATLDYDFSQQTVIHLRLVCKADTDAPRPLTSYSSPVPPPIY